MATFGFAEQGPVEREGPGAWWERPLPPLLGRWLTAYTVLWLLLLVLAVAVPVASTWIKGMQPSLEGWEPLGLSVNARQAPHPVTLVWGDEARAAGIRPGDMVVAIEGWQVRRGASVETRNRLEKPEGTEIELTVRGASGAERKHRLLRRSANIQALLDRAGSLGTILRAMLLVASLGPSLCMILAAALLFPRRREAMAALLSSLLLLMSASVWNAAVTWEWLRLQAVGSVLSVISWTGFSLALLLFPSGRFEPLRTRWLALLVLLLGAVQLVLELGRSSTTGPLIALCWLASAALVISGLRSRYRRTPAGLERQQLRWTFLGFVAGPAMLIVLFLVTLVEKVFLAHRPVASLAAAILVELLIGIMAALSVAGLIVSTLRFRLYDADLAISRSAAVAMLTLLLAAVFAATAKGAEVLVDSYFGERAGALPAVAAAGLVVMLIHPLNARLQTWAERRFRQRLLSLRRDLPACVDDLRETCTLAELLDEITARAAKGANAGSAAILLGGDVAAVHGTDPDTVATWRSSASLDPAAGCELIFDDRVFPLRVPLRVRHSEDGALGWLLVGLRPDGTLPDADEREALSDAADAIARAIRIVERREQWGRANRAAIAAITARLDALEARVGTASRPRRRQTATKALPAGG
ncbi:hypothetical protein E2493_13040 [Sphingomonas parva]|uniref:PDZ domain-containing protein n=1 Tax=Sphingomonas parva TaxID=2555898 RepID=A0A4Y8ZP86_9SPHN|nr:hypothetical protein [Sphingomonas parva]TFI57823.1 hypothetical protein E2493_13040 [Sphingomonas parva]